MEATHSSETSVLTRATWQHFPEDNILQEERKYIKFPAPQNILFYVSAHEAMESEVLKHTG
jgi:hypothetical protein